MIGDIRQIAVIQSLKEEEIKTGADLYNDCIRRRIDFIQPDELKMTHKFFDVNSKKELEEVLSYYIANSPYMHGGILIHFEIHGENERKGLVLANRELITWDELVVLLRQININCNNKLFLTMATCYGRFLYKGVHQFEKSPFSGYISASEIVSNEEIMGDFEGLFEKLIENGNIVEAYLALEENGSNFYYKDLESILMDALKISVEQLLSDEEGKKEVLQMGIENAREKGYEEPTEELTEQVLHDVVVDMFEKVKDSFMFR